jgi:hypothetical protein
LTNVGRHGSERDVRVYARDRRSSDDAAGARRRHGRARGFAPKRLASSAMLIEDPPRGRLRAVRRGSRRTSRSARTSAESERAGDPANAQSPLASAVDDTELGEARKGEALGISSCGWRRRNCARSAASPSHAEAISSSIFRCSWSLTVDAIFRQSAACCRKSSILSICPNPRCSGRVIRYS